MSYPYVGEIRLFGGNFAPAGWAWCNGATIPISENETLFNLIGTYYGGDGSSTFCLPDLQGRVPIHQGTGPSGQTYQLAQTGGQETVTLTINEMPSHNHAPGAQSAPGTQSTPAGGVWATSASAQFSSVAPNVAMDGAAVVSTGGSQPHDNMIPFLVVTFIISLFGVYPNPT